VANGLVPFLTIGYHIISRNKSGRAFEGKGVI